MIILNKPGATHGYRALSQALPLLLLLIALPLGAAHAQTSITNPYWVYGSNTPPSALYACWTPIESGFTPLGSASLSQTFQGNYAYYIITNFDDVNYDYNNAPSYKPIYLDAIQWSDGSWFTGNWGTSNTANYLAASGAPDKKFAEIGSNTWYGCATIPATLSNPRFITAEATDIVNPTLQLGNVGATSATLSWNAVLNATGYYLDLSTDSAFNSFVSGYNNLALGNVTSASLSGLPSGATLFGRLRAAKDGATSSNSQTLLIPLAKNNAYHIYGYNGSEKSCWDRSSWLSLSTLLGSTADTQTFSGQYDNYIVTNDSSDNSSCLSPSAPIYIDALQFGDGTTASNQNCNMSSNTLNFSNVYGVPDGKYVMIGYYSGSTSNQCGCLSIRNTTSAASLKVTTVSSEPTEVADLTGSWLASFSGFTVRIDLFQTNTEYQGQTYGRLNGVARVRFPGKSEDDLYHLSGMAGLPGLSSSIMLSHSGLDDDGNYVYQSFQGNLNENNELVGTLTLGTLYIASSTTQSTNYSVTASRDTPTGGFVSGNDLGGDWATSVLGRTATAALTYTASTLQGTPIGRISGTALVDYSDTTDAPYTIQGFVQDNGRVVVIHPYGENNTQRTLTGTAAANTITGLLEQNSEVIATTVILTKGGAPAPQSKFSIAPMMELLKEEN